ncbi:Hypothetical predicted protein [Lecanosticta acicola]|uniref:Altered inheritance of mitochondria protein 9, mitochondrial n=1 Tax=Lecanosticta acicola TaxID=111012 RepID=A0AAI8YYD6_9PEZI|nr:Hypothetical predicted protein [Lecanosticta acicola]
MNSHQRMLVTKALGFMCKDMAALEFPAYGCIYFDNVNLPQSSLIPISGGKSIGPHCGNRYWSVAPGDPRTYARRPPNQGPWTTHAEYLRALTDAGDSRIPTSTDTRNLEFKGTVDQHLHLHRASEEILLSLAQTEPLQSTCTPTLLHHDMHKRNIFVSEQDPSQITALIDWQSSAVEPSHAYSDEMPDLCQKPEDWDDAELKDPLNDEQRKKVNELSILQRTWEVIVRAYMPEIYRARAMDQDFLRVAQYASSAWRHGAVPVREDLIQLSRRWSGELGLSGPCPYQPTTEEIEMQKRLWPQFRDNLDLRKMLYKGLRTDEAGWVPIDRWEDTRIAHKTLFDEWYHHVVESGEFTEEQARMAWPYDIP